MSTDLSGPTIGVTLMGPPASLAASARQFERVGVDQLWTGDYFQSALVRAAVLVNATERIPVGTHVLQAFARSALATALAAQELQELSGGRFVLGLGSQLPAANRRWHGVEIAAPVAALGDYIAGVRRLLEGADDQRWSYRGQFFEFAVPAYRPPGPPIEVPIWVGGAGPATTRLAARTADGLAGHLLWGHDHVRTVVRPLVETVRDRPITVTVARFVAPDTVPGWRGDLAQRLAHYALTPAYQPVLAEQRIPVDRPRLADAVRDRNDTALLNMMEPLLDLFTISDPSGLAEQLDRARANGIDGVNLVVPADPCRSERTAAYESELAELLSSFQSPAGSGRQE